MGDRLKYMLLLALVVLCGYSAANAAAERVSLDGRWLMQDYAIGMGMWVPHMGIVLVDPPPDSARITAEAIPATVPGSVQRNLLAAGRIEDPYVGDNCLEIKWVEDREWWFVRSFDVPAGWNGKLVELRCKMINYQADVWVNQTWCGRTVGNYQPLVIPVDQALKPGEPNQIFIRLRAPENSSKSIPEPKFLDWTSRDGGTHLRPWVTPTNPQAGEFLMSKCLFGWDWGPHIVPVGILQSIELVATGLLRLEDAYVSTLAISADSTASMAVKLTLSNHTDQQVKATLRYTAKRKDTQVPVAGGDIQVELAAGSDTTIDQRLKIEHAALWWPLRHGEQALYQIEAELVSGGRTVSTLTDDFGVRTLEYAANDDPQWTKFRESNTWSETHSDGEEYDWTFVINGRKIFAQGMNWIPVDAMLDLHPERYRYLLRLAADAGVNMIRVWGEGLYETDTFYQLCDSLGIMVWQDFWIGSYSNAQPQEASWKAVRDNLVRTRNHPSLVLYCGGNEFDANRPDRVAQIDKLGEMIDRYDGTRQFHKASPHGGNRHGGMGILPREEWPRRYKRFVSEGGYQQSWPPRADLLKFLPEEQLFPLDQNKYYLGIRNAYVAFFQHENDEIYGVPQSLDELIHIEMLNNVIGWQSELENTRLARFKVSGCLFWNINAVWPTTSWAMVDYYGTRKHSFYEFKRAASPLLATASQQYPILKPGEPYELDVELINDYPAPQAGLNVIATIHMGEQGGEVYRQEFKASVGANSVAGVGKLDWTVPGNTEEHNFLLRLDMFDAAGKPVSRNEYTCQIGDSERKSVSGGFFGEYRQWAKNSLQPVVDKLPESIPRGGEREFEISYRNTSGNVVMALEAMITDLPEGVRFYLDENYVNLLPGESVTLHGSLQVTERAAADLKELSLTLQTDGWNVERQARKLTLRVE